MSSAVNILTSPICLSGSVENPTPIHVLPVELLHMIFTFVDEGEGEGDRSLCMKTERWQLGRVCRWWRIIVEETPSLWTLLNVNLAEAAMLRDAAALLRHTLHLTKGQALTVLLDFGTEICDDNDEEWTRESIMLDLLNIIVAHAPCWQSVVLTHCDAAWWHVLSETIGSTTLAKLEKLTVIDISADEDFDYEDEDEDEEDDEDESDDEYDDWVPNAPLLELFVVHNALLNFCHPLMPQLKRFALLGVVAYVTLAHFLHISPQLQVLWAHHFNDDDSDWDSDPPIEIPARVTSHSLLHLALHGSINDLETVDLPNLRTLKAGEIKMAGAAPYLTSIFNLVQYSRPPLTSLVLLNCNLAVGNLVDILRLLPLLTELEIHFGYYIEFNDEFNGNVDRALSSLTSAMGDVDRETEAFTLMPVLEEFRINFYDYEEVASAYKWTFYTPKVEEDFKTRERRNGKFEASCTSKGQAYFGCILPGPHTSWA